MITYELMIVNTNSGEVRWYRAEESLADAQAARAEYTGLNEYERMIIVQAF